MSFENRFAELLSPAAKQVELYNRPLLQTAEWIVAPSLGAIIPNWLLLIPRSSAINMKTWAGDLRGGDPLCALRGLLSHLALTPDDVIWFEHGAREIGTPVGCGVDHAHMHCLIKPPFKLDELLAAAQELSPLAWTEVSGDAHVYDTIKARSSYLVVGAGRTTFFSEDVERTGSQFLRRAVARLVGSKSWNYRDHPQAENVEETVRTFVRLSQESRVAA